VKFSFGLPFAHVSTRGSIMVALARITLWLGGLGFLAFGLAFLIAPLETMAAAGLQLQGDLAATELRAFYGGLELALGALLIAADLHPAARQADTAEAGQAQDQPMPARLLGIALAGSATPFLWAALATELTLATLSAVALRGLPRG
jgi:hypothetical protein